MLAVRSFDDRFGLVIVEPAGVAGAVGRRGVYPISRTLLATGAATGVATGGATRVATGGATGVATGGVFSSVGLPVIAREQR